MARNDKMGRELVTQPEVGLAERPSFVPVEATGLEHVRKDDLLLPRMSLAQALSPEKTEGDPRFIEGLRTGEMFNNLTRQVYGVGPLSIIIVRADPPRYVEFFPRDDGGGVKDLNVPANDPRTQFGPNGEKPLATKFYDYIVLLMPSGEMIALSFKGSGLKVARQLNALAKMRNAPLYAGVYALSSSITKNTKGSFAIPDVRNAGWCDEETFKLAKQRYDDVRDKILQVDREPGDDTEFDPDKLE